MFSLTASELHILRRLNTPANIQDFLDTLPINFEHGGETCMSPRRVLRERRAHCMEAAMLAAAALRLHGHLPLVLDLKVTGSDEEHVVTLFKDGGCWGAISKTNHGVLRYRDPVYRSVRELAMSYFHEYTDKYGKKILRSFSRPIDLSRFDRNGWMTDEEELWYIPEYLDSVYHMQILTRKQVPLRRADAMERLVGSITEWNRQGKRKIPPSR